MAIHRTIFTHRWNYIHTQMGMNISTEGQQNGAEQNRLGFCGCVWTSLIKDAWLIVNGDVCS
eukprot:scaffold267491_cov17-Prasinocladus_malaysianus.AAC.1